MNLKAVRLTESERKAFAYLDPLGFLSGQSAPEQVCIGMVDIKEQQPVGLLIAQSRPDAVIVDWIFVNPGRRYQGIGGHLMRTAFEEAKKRGQKRLYAIIKDAESRSRICPGEMDFIMDYGMTEVRVQRRNAEVYDRIVPKKDYGALLYFADVDTYYNCIEKVTANTGPIYAATVY